MAGSIRGVSAERVRDELVRILVEGDARRGVELLDESGLLAELLPEVAAMKGIGQPPEFHPEGDVWTHTLLMLGLLRNPPLRLALAVLLHDVGKPPTFRRAERIRFDGHAEVGARMAASILRRLRFANEEIRCVESLIADHERFLDVRRMRESTLKRFLRQLHFPELLELHRLDCLASHRRLDNYDYVQAKLRDVPQQELKPERLITGEDLIRLGYKPGPAFRRMLEAVEDAQLERAVRTAEDALRLVRIRFGPPGGPASSGA
jgi:poly(A) polymerase